jgi:hypothetical protein
MVDYYGPITWQVIWSRTGVRAVSGMIEGGSAYLRHMAATDATRNQSNVRKTSTVLSCVPQRSLQAKMEMWEMEMSPR